MRRIRYQVAMSLDGYIAGANEEVDWIVTDPEIDFGALYKQFDTALIGRKTFEYMNRAGAATLPGMKMYVFSKKLRQSDYPGISVIADNAEQVARELRDQQGKDIWLFGGGSLFQSLLNADLVDCVEVAVMPAIVGGGIPFVETPAASRKLTLVSHKVYKSGIVMLTYDVQR